MNEQTFQTIIFPVSVVSTGSPRLQHDIEYVFQVYGVFTINNVEYESERSPPVTVIITMDSSTTSTSSSPSLISSSNDSQTGSTGLVAGVSVLSIIVIISLVVIIVIFFKILIKKPKEKERFSIDISNYYELYSLVFRSTVKSSSDVVVYETIEDSKLVTS